jgi:hypothetical protein
MTDKRDLEQVDRQRAVGCQRRFERVFQRQRRANKRFFVGVEIVKNGSLSLGRHKIARAPVEPNPVDIERQSKEWSEQQTCHFHRQFTTDKPSPFFRAKQTNSNISLKYVSMDSDG